MWRGPSVKKSKVGELFYAVSTTEGAVSSAGRFAFSQTFALQRPKNGAAITIANEIAIAILTVFSFPQKSMDLGTGNTHRRHLRGGFNIDVLNIGLNRYYSYPTSVPSLPPLWDIPGGSRARPPETKLRLK